MPVLTMFSLCAPFACFLGLSSGSQAFPALICPRMLPSPLPPPIPAPQPPLPLDAVAAAGLLLPPPLSTGIRPLAFLESAEILVLI